MSKQITLKGFVQFKRAGFFDHETKGDAADFSFWEYENMTEHGYQLVCPVHVTFTVPEGFDPVTGEINVLKAKRKALETQFNAEVTRIDTEISKLLAISYEPEAVL